MRSKYTTNYKINLIIIAVMLIFVSLFEMLIWKESLTFGIVVIIAFIGVTIYGVCFSTERIKSVEVGSSAIVIKYRKTSVTVPFEDFKKLTHYKHGPLTERILVHAKDYIYEIPYDLKDFYGMCKSIYRTLSKINMEHIADDWFLKKFGDERSLETTNTTNNYDTREKYTANYPLLWVLFVVQFTVVSLFIILIWASNDMLFSVMLTIITLFMEYLGVLAITSPRITNRVTLGGSEIIIALKKERVEIPIASCEQIHYHRPWPRPKRILIFTKERRCALLPWYIKNFRNMGKSIYQALERSQMEDVASKQFQKKFGKRKPAR